MKDGFMGPGELRRVKSRAHFGAVAVSCGAATATSRLIIRAGSRSVLLTLTPLRPLVRFGYNQALAAYR
ncbi:hypothetical protein QC762_0099430 [Podospora pseudocomata]|uniref:Uncharacterized protein n=1 Tax=Podospora pseudocomata TaxID=2093779 RepID=A0ABR0G8L1_9PEZI|nr:hypothetical protein QC762_0099430 [Podospora pseudocomata]